jgi:hypothetical protein
MGRRNRIRNASPSNPVIHRDKLFGGRTNAMDLHRRLAWGGKKCDGCGAADTAIRIQTFVALNDMSMATRMEIEFRISLGQLHTINTAAGRAIRTGIMHACPRCSPALERAAAKGPSYAIVDIDRGPGEDKPVVGVISAI